MLKFCVVWTGMDAFIVFSADAHKSEYVAGEKLHVY
jgi:hypothetical protein